MLDRQRLLVMATTMVAAMTTTTTTTLAFTVSPMTIRKANAFSSLTRETRSKGTLFPTPPPKLSPRNMMATEAMDMPPFAQTLDPTTLWLSFADQGQNLAGIFFQASLLPYLIFLYFLTFRGNRTPELGAFGFQFLLLFVLSTIPGGILSKSVYGESLANVDWLHGGAEALLTVTNVLVVLGFRNAILGQTPATRFQEGDYGNEWSIGVKARLAALASALAFAAACFVGPDLLQAHSAFLFGLGDLPSDWTVQLPWVMHNEPANALSIPTWAIHFSSVYEFLFAMGVIWEYSKVTGNDRWKGLTWGMLPSHASGIAACTYHFFYNDGLLQSLVTTQAGLTLLGNITLAIAAYRIAVSNGWNIRELNPFPQSSTSPINVAADMQANVPLSSGDSAAAAAASAAIVTNVSKDSNWVLGAKLTGLTFVSAYVMKYGELALDIPFQADERIAFALVFGIPAITAFYFYNQSDGGISLPSSLGQDGKGPSVSMNDVKKFGVAGTVAYILTELAFWAVAFPVASTALYQSTGHWPDVLHDPTDRATVAGAIFAGANVARLLVPLRLGAALALAPWVDDNLISRLGNDKSSSGTGSGGGSAVVMEEE